MTTKTTARVSREVAKEEVRCELVKASFETDTEQKQIAESCGVSQQTASVWTQRDGTKSPLVADLHNMPSAVALPLIRQAAQKHGQDIAPAHGDDVDLSSVGDIHKVMTECNEAVQRWMAAIADGKLSAAELAGIAKEAREAMNALGKVEAAARREAAKLNHSIV